MLLPIEYCHSRVQFDLSLCLQNANKYEFNLFIYIHYCTYSFPRDSTRVHSRLDSPYDQLRVNPYTAAVGFPILVNERYYTTVSL